MQSQPPGPIDAEGVGSLGTILSIWAHPDDETFLAGGVMAAATARGQRVVCVCATAGENGTDDPVQWPPQRLGQMRRWEAAAAMAILGVDDHRFLDLPDGGLAALDPQAPVTRLAEIMREVQPDTILTFGPDGRTFHPDHQTVSRWVGEAWQRAGYPARLLHQALSVPQAVRWASEFERWGVYMSDERPVSVPVDELAVRFTMDGQLLDQKYAALCAMHTQIGPSIALLGEKLFQDINSEECFVEVVR
jgi:LmbE family N-acetylglucosaminyl deacetylase